MARVAMKIDLEVHGVRMKETKVIGKVKLKRNKHW